MSTWKDSGLDVDRANGAGVATIDTRLTLENAATDDLLFQLADSSTDSGGIPALFSLFIGEFIDDLGANCTELAVANHLLADLVGLGDACFSGSSNSIGQGSVNLGRLPVPIGGARLGLQLADRLDDGLQLLMAIHNGTKHHLFTQQVGL